MHSLSNHSGPDCSPLLRATLIHLIDSLDHIPEDSDTDGGMIKEDKAAERRNLSISAKCFNAILGEDFMLACLEHFFKKGDLELLGKVEIYRESLSRQKAKKGQHRSQIDAWIRVGDAWYLTEVKNWSARSLGGRSQPMHEVRGVSEEEGNIIWTKQYEASFKDSNDLTLRKLFYDYTPPSPPKEEIRRLLAVWDPVYPASGTLCPPGAFFWKNVVANYVPDPGDQSPASAMQSPPFFVFSLSRYLRHLVSDSEFPGLSLNLEPLRRRLSVVNALMHVAPPPVAEIDSQPNDNTLIVSISQSWGANGAHRSETLIDAARGWWSVCREKAEHIRILVAIHQGTVVGIFSATNPQLDVDILGRGKAPARSYTFDLTKYIGGPLTVHTASGLSGDITLNEKAPDCCRLYQSFRYGRVDTGKAGTTRSAAP